jgi:hypothetical protein
MVNIPLGKSDWRRYVSGEPLIQVRNRYFEQNPTNQEEATALLARPALKRWKEIGSGPIRGLYSQPGAFNDALFVLSGETLYRVDQNDAVTEIGSGFFIGDTDGFASMASTAAIGPGTPEMLYIADGQTLWLYMQNGYALGTLTATGTITNGETLRIGDVYYSWTSGSVNAGTPAGTSANPWLVALGTSNAEALDNLRLAIDNSGAPGTTYSLALTAHPTVSPRSSTATTLSVQAIDVGTGGNGIVTTETGANISWGAATLTGGGAPYLTSCPLPDDLFAISVGFIAGYIIVIPKANVDGYNGRWFWIEPGETYIRPLNFNTAERSPDPLISVRVIGDQFWLFGTNTTEVWYPSGDPLDPFLRSQGQLFDRGIVEGTDVAIKDSVIVVDTDGVVYILAGGRPTRVSTHSIEERIRNDIRLASLF